MENLRQGKLRFRVKVNVNPIREEKSNSLTSKEMESDDRSIRYPVKVNRFSRSNDLVRQRHEVPNRRSRSNILEVRSGLRRRALLPVLLQLGIRL